MARIVFLAAGLALTALSACEGVVPYHQSPNTVIAKGQDYGIDNGVLLNGHAAIAYDPDGCQGWIMDDGIEGYAGRRYDPKSDLPVCNAHYPPGTVLGDYRQQDRIIPDFVPYRYPPPACVTMIGPQSSAARFHFVRHPPVLSPNRRILQQL